MRIAPRRSTLSILAAALAVIPATLAFGQGDPLGQRQAIMKRMDEQVELAVAMAKGNTPFDAAKAAGILDALREGGSRFTEFFPPGSDAGKTKATASVWTDRPGFEAANAAFLKAVAAADTSTARGFSAAVSSVVRECRSCHQGFKSR